MGTVEIRRWFNDRANLFVLNIFIVYALWKSFSYYVKNTDGVVSQLWMKFTIGLGGFYAHLTSFILNNFMGQKTAAVGKVVVYTDVLRTIRVEEHCLAIPATILFVGTVAFFKGSWRNKAWFIPLGIFFIFIINLIRLVALCYTFAYYPGPFFEISHSYFYVIITYSLIFLLIVWWMRRFTGSKV